MWTLDDALILVRMLNPRLQQAGFACALTGSVLINGVSDYDLDLIVYPLDSTEVSLRRLYDALVAAHWCCDVDRHRVLSKWVSKGSFDDKFVEIWLAPDGRRVDLFLLR